MSRLKNSGEGSVTRCPNGRWLARVSVDAKRSKRTVGSQAEDTRWLRHMKGPADQRLIATIGHSLSVAAYPTTGPQRLPGRWIRRPGKALSGWSAATSSRASAAGSSPSSRRSTWEAATRPRDGRTPQDGRAGGRRVRSASSTGRPELRRIRRPNETTCSAARRAVSPSRRSSGARARSGTRTRWPASRHSSQGTGLEPAVRLRLANGPRAIAGSPTDSPRPAVWGSHRSARTADLANALGLLRGRCWPYGQ